MAPLGQGLCLQSTPSRQAAEKGDDQEMLWPGTQNALARMKAVDQWIVLVWMSSVRRSGFHFLGELKHSSSLGVFFPKGESLLPTSMTNLANCGLCGRAAAG